MKIDARIVSIHRLYFLFKIQFQKYLRKKSPTFFPVGSSFCVLKMKCLSKCPYCKKPLLPWKFPGYEPGFWICLWFWIFQGSVYVRFTQGSEYAWIYLNNSWICLIIPEYAWIYLNNSWIYLNLQEWFLFYILPLQSLVYFNA